MSLFLGIFRLITPKQGIKNNNFKLGLLSQHARSYADTPETDVTKVVQGAESEGRVRVRRARPADVPRVLRFVQQHSSEAWPCLVAPSSASHIVLCDYVARALAQGHSMLAEQQRPRQGLSKIRGLALATAVCPWDATMLEKWARCIQCTQSRRLVHYTAHCLRAPALHDKYRVHNILQIILIVPLDTPKSTEIAQVLAKNAIKRGREVGFPVLRFDVTDASIAKSLEEMNLKTEWKLSYQDLLDPVKNSGATTAVKSVSSTVVDAKVNEKEDSKKSFDGKFISIYTAFTQEKKN